MKIKQIVDSEEREVSLDDLHNSYRWCNRRIKYYPKRRNQEPIRSLKELITTNEECRLWVICEDDPNYMTPCEISQKEEVSGLQQIIPTSERIPYTKKLKLPKQKTTKPPKGKRP